MEHKSWPWKKKSTEKTMLAADKVNRGNEDEGILADKAELERNLKVSTEKLSVALAEANAKDEIAKKQINIAQEAIQGWEKAESEAIALKEELQTATQQRVAGEERLCGVDAALKECMLQLRFVREEQEKRIHGAVTKTSIEFEETRTILEEKLAESNKRLSKLISENTQLSKTLLAKERIIEELHSIRAQLDSDLSAVMGRLESTQRENGSLIYEVRVLEKELEIRNEERDFNRRTADVAHKQHLESVKKIAKLETEVQRLRLLMRKRLPGPGALAKMKNEVEVLGRDSVVFSRRMSNPFPIASKDCSVGIPADTSSKRIALLTEQLHALEEENRVLKEFLSRKTSHLSKSQMATGPAKNHITSQEFSMAASSSDIGSDEKVSVAESWAPSWKTTGASDIGLMDDFVEMEKLAIVSMDKPFASSNLVAENHSDWLDNVLKVVSEHARITQRSSSEILEDIKLALAGKTNYNLNKSIDKKDANGYISEESKTPEKPVDKGLCEEQFHLDSNGSIQRLIEVLEGIRFSVKDDEPTGYTVRIFQWKTSELCAVLETFLQSCTKLLNGKADADNFVKELTSTLEWIVNHCFSLQDVSSMKDEIKKHFDWDETRSESEAEGSHMSELDKLHFPKDQLTGWPMASSWNVRNKIFHMEREEVRKLKDELANLESANKDLESRLRLESGKSTSLITQLEESEKTVGNLQTEVKTLKKQMEMIEDQMKVEIMVVEDLDKQLIEAIGECNVAHQLSMQEKKSSTNEELESPKLESMVEKDTESCDLNQDERRLRSEQEITAASEKLAECQETILSLGKKLKSLASPNTDTSSSDKLTNPTCEITQSPLTEKSNEQRTSLLDKMLSEDATGALQSPEVTRSLTSPATFDGNPNPIMTPQRFVSVNGIVCREEEEALVDFLSVVPSKKKNSGGGVLKRLFGRRKKGNNK